MYTLLLPLLSIDVLNLLKPWTKGCLCMAPIINSYILDYITTGVSYYFDDK